MQKQNFLLHSCIKAKYPSHFGTASLQAALESYTYIGNLSLAGASLRSIRMLKRTWASRRLSNSCLSSSWPGVSKLYILYCPDRGPGDLRWTLRLQEKFDRDACLCRFLSHIRMFVGHWFLTEWDSTIRMILVRNSSVCWLVPLKEFTGIVPRTCIVGK